LAGYVNGLDVFIIGSFAVIVYISYKRGLLLSLFDFSSRCAALLLTNWLYPCVADAVSGNEALYGGLRRVIGNYIVLPPNSARGGLDAQARLIEKSGLPRFITEVLIKNNNPEVYGIFRASGLRDYISAAAADFVINVVSAGVVFILTSAALWAASRALGLASKIPVLKTFNRAGGVVLGVLLWILFNWAAMLAVFIIFPKNAADITALIDGSVLARLFYKNNLFMYMVLRRFI
jgi:hypothetical protein